MLNKLSELLGGIPPQQLKTYLMIAAAIIFMMVMGDGSGNKLAKSFKGGKKETKAARTRAIAQMKAGIYNEVSLSTVAPLKGQKKRSASNILYITDAQRGLAAMGAPNSGKTFSIIDPATRSGIDQGFPVILYDFKYPDQTAKLAAYAKDRGYEVHIFAPGFEESGICNLLDFMESETDALMARQIAATLNSNASKSKNASRDEFFGDAGDQLVQAVLQLAKSLPRPDLLTASVLLSLNKLPERIIKAKELSDKDGYPDWSLSIWVYMAFNQLLQIKDSEKTLGGVLATASRIFSKFMVPELMSAFCGETTIPLSMHGKKLLIFGLDQNRRDAISPILAATLHMVVAKSLYDERTDPLLLVLDELPTIHLPHLVKWMNESRYKGLCTILGFQNIGQIEEAYGRGILQAIMSGCATKAIFNPQDKNSAEYFSGYLGEEEIKVKQKSKGYGKGGTSRNVSMNLNKRALVEAAELNRFPIGRMIYINPGYMSRQDAYVPLVVKGSIPKSDQKKVKISKRRWPKLRAQYTRLASTQRVEKEEIEERFSYLKKMFSLDDAERPGQLPSPGDPYIKDPALLRRIATEVF